MWYYTIIKTQTSVFFEEHKRRVKRKLPKEESNNGEEREKKHPLYGNYVRIEVSEHDEKRIGKQSRDSGGGN